MVLQGGRVCLPAAISSAHDSRWRFPRLRAWQYLTFPTDHARSLLDDIVSKIDAGRSPTEKSTVSFQASSALFICGVTACGRRDGREWALEPRMRGPPGVISGFECKVRRSEIGGSGRLGRR